MTLFLAIWGAAIGTLTFFWNLWKWKQESPHVKATVEAVESTWTENSSGIRLLLRNRGGKKTTIEEILLYRRQEWFSDGLTGILFRVKKIVPWGQNLSVSNPKTIKLPVILDVHETWEGFIPFEANEADNEDEQRIIDRNREAARLLQIGKLRYSIHCSHTDRRITGFVKNEQRWPTE
jgi:hypothetical protein